MTDVHKNYLFDLGYLLRERALEAKAAHDAAKGADDEAFQSGQRIAYYAVMSLLISQAKSFHLPIEDLHLEGLDPDRDLGHGTPPEV
jgi:hypothetical protein